MASTASPRQLLNNSRLSQKFPRSNVPLDFLDRILSLVVRAFRTGLISISGMALAWIYTNVSFCIVIVLLIRLVALFFTRFQRLGMRITIHNLGVVWPRIRQRLCIFGMCLARPKGRKLDLCNDNTAAAPTELPEPKPRYHLRLRTNRGKADVRWKLCLISLRILFSIPLM